MSLQVIPDVFSKSSDEKTLNEKTIWRKNVGRKDVDEVTLDEKTWYLLNALFQDYT